MALTLSSSHGARRKEVGHSRQPQWRFRRRRDACAPFQGASSFHPQDRYVPYLTQLSHAYFLWLLASVTVVCKTGDPRAKMRYTAAQFYENVFKRRRLLLPGWPGHIPFQNLSYLRKAELLELLECLEDGALHFAEVDEDVYYAHANNIKGVAPGKFKHVGNFHPGRSDNKKSRFNKETGEPISSTRKLRLTGAKTPKHCIEFREVWVEVPPLPSRKRLARGS